MNNSISLLDYLITTYETEKLLILLEKNYDTSFLPAEWGDAIFGEFLKRITPELAVQDGHGEIQQITSDGEKPPLQVKVNIKKRRF